MMTITFGCWFTQCARNEETHTRNDDRNLHNSTATFIYNAIPENPQAVVSSEYSTAINTFSVNLLDEVYKNESFHNKNVILSPYCINRNLAIITEATVGESKEELLSVLGGQAALDDARSALSRILYADNSVILQCADALWVDSLRYTLLPSFRDTANTKYGVEVTGLPFDNLKNTVTTINSWIAKNTDNRIKNALDINDIAPITPLILTSTIYFEADWTSPFDVTKTKPHLFSTPSGSVEVAMMESNYHHQTRKTDEYENVKLYYGTSDKDFFYLDVYMPTTISVDSFIAEKCLAALGSTDSFEYGGLQMPKFFFENEIDCIPILKNMGVNGIFDPGKSELTGMVSNKDGLDSIPLYLYLVLHKAGIKTDEEGTVAYAVTISAPTNKGDISLSPDVVLDRPFVYFIRAGENGLVLFAGVVNDPNENT